MDGGVLGTGTHYAGSVEEQGRKTLHLHLLLWIKDYNLQSIEQKIASHDINFISRLKLYLSSVIKESYPGIGYVPNGGSRFKTATCLKEHSCHEAMPNIGQDQPHSTTIHKYLGKKSYINYL